MCDEALARQAPHAQTFLEKVISGYGTYFDVERDTEVQGHRVSALAHFISRGEKYVLTKKAQIWAVECEEYAAVFDERRLSRERMREIIGLMEAAEAEFVKPRPEHMYTNLTAVVVADAVDGDVRDVLRRHRFRKNYKFSLHGFSTLRIAVVDMDAKAIHINRDGAEVRNFLRGILHPKPPKKRGARR